MQRILLASDFSTRSDRALRRATLLAQQFSSELLLAHVVDDDIEPRLLASRVRDSKGLLEELAATVREADHVPCAAELGLGEPFLGINAIAERSSADLVVIGPHRRSVLRDIFVGTTAERTIRHASAPVLMANAVPAGRYGRVLVATDLSDASGAALSAARALRLFDGAWVSVLHAYAAPAEGLMLRSGVTLAQQRDYLEQERAAARRDLDAFLEAHGLRPDDRAAVLVEITPAACIREYARRIAADLIVVGVRGRSGLQKLILGSVAEEVLRSAEADVLAVPAMAREAAGGI